MHNRKKLDRPLSENELKAIRDKCTTYQNLVDLIFAKRKAQDLTVETLDLVGKMLMLNPDFYSLWNFRREILFHQYPDLPVLVAKAERCQNADLRDKELKISAEGIRKNPKSCAFLRLYLF
jgi:hypothetical protein